jgi:hypothetical protein
VATALELKQRLLALEAEVVAHRNRLGALEAREHQAVTVAPTQEAEVEVTKARKMCPKCGEKPNYFFHVKTCQGKK